MSKTIFDMTEVELYLHALGDDDPQETPAEAMLHQLEYEARTWANILTGARLGYENGAANLSPVFQRFERHLEVVTELLRRGQGIQREQAKPAVTPPALADTK